MPSWECPNCGVANLAGDESCRACRTRRPYGWVDGTWTCPRCDHTNSNADTHCDSCGYRPGVDAQTSMPERRSAAQQVSDDILAEMRKTNDALLGEIRGELTGLTGRPKSASRPEPPFALPVVHSTSARPGPEAFTRATTRTLNLKVSALPKLNFAMVHAGVPVISELTLTNNDRTAAHDLVIRAWVSPDYGEAWQTTVSGIEPGCSHVEARVMVPLKKARLQEVREAERASLRIDVSSEGTLVQSQTLPLEVLAYNEWYFHPAIPHTSACFVQPNSPAVERIVSLVRDRLRRRGGDPSLAGYQQGGRARVTELTAALYDTLQQDVSLSYINPPASFEQPQRLADGGVTISQKVFLPEQILEHGRGTCLDLALLGASCLERMGLNALLFVVQGHAFFGAWLEPSMLREPWTRDEALVREFVESDQWLPVNSTTFTSQPMEAFDVACAEARTYLAAAGRLHAVIDIAAARRAGLKPIPPLTA